MITGVRSRGGPEENDHLEVFEVDLRVDVLAEVDEQLSQSELGLQEHCLDVVWVAHTSDERTDVVARLFHRLEPEAGLLCICALQVAERTLRVMVQSEVVATASIVEGHTEAVEEHHGRREGFAPSPELGFDELRVSRCHEVPLWVVRISYFYLK